MCDYGTIHIYVHPHLDIDQLVSIVKQSVENQLITDDRSHFIEIQHQCIEFSKLFYKNVPFVIEFKMNKYTYTLKIFGF